MSATKIVLTPRGLLEFESVDPSLKAIVWDVIAEWWDDDIEFGRIHSTPAENIAALSKSEIHVAGPPYRALDVRTRIEGEGFQAKADELAAKINAKWQYDPARPFMVVAYSAVHGTGPHLHLQCHPSTRLRPAADLTV